MGGIYSLKVGLSCIITFMFEFVPGSKFVSNIIFMVVSDSFLAFRSLSRVATLASLYDGLYKNKQIKNEQTTTVKYFLLPNSPCSVFYYHVLV